MGAWSWLLFEIASASGFRGRCEYATDTINHSTHCVRKAESVGLHEEVLDHIKFVSKDLQLEGIAPPPVRHPHRPCGT